MIRHLNFALIAVIAWTVTARGAEPSDAPVPAAPAQSATAAAIDPAPAPAPVPYHYAAPGRRCYRSGESSPLPTGRRYYNGRYYGNFNNRYYGPQYGYF